MRWRNIKQQKKNQTPSKIQEKNIKALHVSPILWRFKAFIVDTFMIYIPLLYITGYGILDGKDSFLSNHLAHFAVTFLFGLILSIFFAKNAQTPGYKAYSMRLVCKDTLQKPSFFRAFFRYFCFLISGASVFGLILCFFRKDKQNLHDLLSKTFPQNTNV